MAAVVRFLAIKKTVKPYVDGQARFMLLQFLDGIKNGRAWEVKHYKHIVCGNGAKIP